MPRSRSWCRLSTAYGQQKAGTTLLRNKYIEIRAEKASSREEAKRSEFKTCKFTSEAIVIEGNEKGEFCRVCSNRYAPFTIRQQTTRDDARWKAEQDQRRKEEAIANAMGISVLNAIGAAVPVRLLKRDLQFLLNQIASLLDDGRLQILARQHGIRKDREMDAIGKLFAALVRRAGEGMLSVLLVESTILLAASRTNPAAVLRNAASVCKVDTDAIALKGEAEFAAKGNAKEGRQTSSVRNGKRGSRPSRCDARHRAHTIGYLAVTGLIALVVYSKLGLVVLRKAWLNLNLVWAAALMCHQRSHSADLPSEILTTDLKT